MWIFRRMARRRQPAVEIVLYGRLGCHLCDEAERLLCRLARRIPMQVRKVDITGDHALLRRYDIRIPVIEIDGSMELDAPIDSEKLERALRAAQSVAARGE